MTKTEPTFTTQDQERLEEIVQLFTKNPNGRETIALLRKLGATAVTYDALVSLAVRLNAVLTHDPELHGHEYDGENNVYVILHEIRDLLGLGAGRLPDRHRPGHA